MSRQTRRTFLKRAAASAGVCTAFTIAGTKASGQVIGANDTVRIGVAGINGRGRNHMDAYCGQDGVQVTYLIDPDSRLFESRSESIKKRGGNTPTCVQDIRKALEDKDLDAVSIASCNHWHSLLAIWSCQAGKDVYVEKPCSHNVFEGRKLVEAAKKYNCIVQHGTQQRSESSRQKSIAAVGSGKYGKLLISYGYASKPRGSIGFKQPEAPPAELDFNLWLGPAPKQPYHGNIVHYNWHWFWDFGNGEIGNQGVHQMDVARWAVEAATGQTLPKSVISLGGRFGYEDQGQTPNTQLTIFDFGEAKLFFEDYGLARGDNRRVDNEFYMEDGVIRGGKFYPNGSDKGEDLDVEYTCQPGGNFGNFVNCVRSRKQEELNAPIDQGHLAAACCHLGNTSYRLGELVPFNKKAAALGDDKDTVEAFETMKDHLGRRTEMNLQESQYKLGRKLNFDPKTEKYLDDPEANEYLTRAYRAPFVVPENV
ncbi:MAG TPA: Gfo/Idh/MocA family oxidoreductase [Thermoguttaceae bacterium]|nr:Gfo/Idh/MocA family oxidoreductase [Thermoguttaceae bacterium]